MKHLIELSDHVYQIAQQAAALEGITAPEWIAATVARCGAAATSGDATVGGAPQREALAEYIGAFDSSTATPDLTYRTKFGDIIADKFRRQGLDIP